MNISEKIRSEFVQRFGKNPRSFRSPGRINLIGEHTDYNEGFVMPASIDLEVHFAILPEESNTLNLVALDLGESYSCTTDDIKRSAAGWPNYLLGVVDELQKSGLNPGGFNCVFSSTIPIGAGLSSSAAIECGIVYALNTLFNLGLGKPDMIRLAQQAENNFVGMKCGIMDQYASMMGREDGPFLLDCRSLKHEYVDFDLKDYRFLIVNSRVKHELTGSEYNTRREECNAAVDAFRSLGYNIAALRDVTFEMLEQAMRQLDPVLARRSRYVVEENHRVKLAKSAMKMQHFDQLGQLLLASHHGLSNLYEVSCDELDFLVAETLDLDAVAGSRMMGGGFGGCTLNLVRADSMKSVQDHIANAYHDQYGLEPEFYIVRLSNGTNEIKE